MESQFDSVQDARGMIMRELGKRCLLLKAMLGLDLEIFQLDQFTVTGQAAKFRDH